MKWKERGEKTFIKTKYVKKIQKMKGDEKHIINLLNMESLKWMSVSSCYWVNLVEELIRFMED